MPIVFDTSALLRPAFTVHDFTTTEWSTADKKADFAGKLRKFIAADFKEPRFTKIRYRRLSLSFGHIAHSAEGAVMQILDTRRQQLLAFTPTLAAAETALPTIIRQFRAVRKAITRPRRRGGSDGFGDIDPTAAGRAAAASAAISGRYEGMIEEVSKNPAARRGGLHRRVRRAVAGQRANVLLNMRQTGSRLASKAAGRRAIRRISVDSGAAKWFGLWGVHPRNSSSSQPRRGKAHTVKISRFFVILTVGLVLTSGASRAAPTTWENDLLNVQVLSPNPQTVLFNGNFTPASAPDNIPIYSNISGQLVINLFPNGYEVINNTSFSPVSIPDVTTIFKVTDLTARRITVAVLEASSVSPVPSLIFGDNFLQFDLNGATIGGLQSGVVVDLGFATPLGAPAPVPAPGPLPVLAFGLLSLGAVRLATKWKASS